MCKSKSKIIKLYICHECHNRIKDNEDFINYKNTTIFCENCFIDNIEKIDMSEFMTRDILINEDTDTVEDGVFLSANQF